MKGHYGLAIGCTIRTGQFLGANIPDQASLSTKVAIITAGKHWYYIWNYLSVYFSTVFHYYVLPCDIAEEIHPIYIH